MELELNPTPRIRKEVSKGNIQVSRVYANEFKEGMLVAELKQTVTTKSFYPKKSVSSSHQDNIFAASDFGFADEEFTSQETRVAWIDVPVGSTVESVQAKLDSIGTATLYRVLSYNPILTDNQRYAVENGITTKDVIAESQAVRYPKGHEQEGELALHNGAVQYRSVFFKTTATEDVDSRQDVSKGYVPESLASEITGYTVVSDQSL